MRKQAVFEWKIKKFENKNEVGCPDFYDDLMKTCEKLRSERISARYRLYCNDVPAIDLTVSSKANTVEVRPKVFFNTDQPKNIQHALQMTPKASYATILLTLTEMVSMIQSKFIALEQNSEMFCFR